jgi:glyoxylase-like metal-dependent hydrolase (beta-lactamase superfamily II)
MTQLKRRDLFAGAAAVTAAAALAPLAPRIAKAAAPAAGSANGGWFRYKVGDFEITVVADGTTQAALPPTYAANASKDQINIVLEQQFMPKDKATQSYTPCVVNTGSKLVAIDTGLGLGMFNQSKGAVGQYHSNLKAAGIDANAVDVVIISHFHGDHINGLVGADNKPAFPNAEVMVPETEWAFWADESNASKLPEPARPQMGNVKRVFGIVGNKMTKYQAGKELVPGITAIETRGHTPGHHSHMVSSGNSRVLVQADVTAGMASLFVAKPEWSLVFDTEKDIAVQTRRKIYDMAATDRLLLQGFHFPFPGMAYIEKVDGGYRLVPAPWGVAS